MMLHQCKKHLLIVAPMVVFCGDNMRVIKGSERFVDVSVLTRLKVSQLIIFNAQALATGGAVVP